MCCLLQLEKGGTLVCIPLVGTTVDQMVIEMRRAREIGADVVEIRLDCLTNFNPTTDLHTLINHTPLPTLVTYRYAVTHTLSPLHLWCQFQLAHVT